MNPETIKKQILNELEYLPVNALQLVREYILLQILHNKVFKENIERDKKERRAASFERLLTYKGSIDRNIDVKKELEEAYTEMYEDSARYEHNN